MLPNTRTLPTELWSYILRDTVLENIHSRLMQASGEPTTWNSLIALPQVCRTFRDISLCLCDRLLGDPTPEQKKGLWHAKSSLEHTLEALDHLSWYSASQFSRLLDKDKEASLLTFLDDEYRASALQLRGLLGLYEVALLSRLFRIAYLKHELASLANERGIMTGISYCLAELLKAYDVDQFKGLISEWSLMIISELYAERLLDTLGSQWWMSAHAIEGLFLIHGGCPPLSTNILTSIVDSLLRGQAAAISLLGCLEKVLRSDFRFSVTSSCIESSGILSALKRLLEQAQDEPDHPEVKPRIEHLFTKLSALVPEHVSAKPLA